MDLEPPPPGVGQLTRKSWPATSLERPGVGRSPPVCPNPRVTRQVGPSLSPSEQPRSRDGRVKGRTFHVVSGYGLRPGLLVDKHCVWELVPEATRLRFLKSVKRMLILGWSQRV